MEGNDNITLRLDMSQWQGGNLNEYHLSSQLLSWLLPASNGPDETVRVVAPDSLDEPLKTEDGMLEGSSSRSGKGRAIGYRRHIPDRILTIGGDCLVDLAPIACLGKRYDRFGAKQQPSRVSSVASVT